MQTYSFCGPLLKTGNKRSGSRALQKAPRTVETFYLKDERKQGSPGAMLVAERFKDRLRGSDLTLRSVTRQKKRELCTSYWGVIL